MEKQGGKPGKAAGIREIAEALGTSIGTVDRALHGRAGVSTRTKARGSFNSILDPGVNHRDFRGTIPHHGWLPAAGYTLTLSAKHNTQLSTPKTLRFTIVATRGH